MLKIKTIQFPNIAFPDHRAFLDFIQKEVIELAQVELIKPNRSSSELDLLLMITSKFIGLNVKVVKKASTIKCLASTENY